MWNASCTTRGISVGCWITNECLTIGIVMPNVSASWKPSVPSSSVRTWPVKATSGTESIIASVSGVTMFVAPGPEVAKHDADLAGRLRVALGGVAAAGLVADEDVADARVDERVVGREVRAARIPEYDVDTLGLEAFHDGVDRTHHRCSAPSAERGQRLSLAARSAADSGSIATSGKSRSVPQRMHIASCSLTTLPQRRALAAHLVALGAVQERGEQPEHRHDGAEIRNQMKNDEPLIRPTIPPARPNQNATTR